MPSGSGPNNEAAVTKPDALDTLLPRVRQFGHKSGAFSSVQLWIGAGLQVSSAGILRVARLKRLDGSKDAVTVAACSSRSPPRATVAASS